MYRSLQFGPEASSTSFAGRNRAPARRSAEIRGMWNGPRPSKLAVAAPMLGATFWLLCGNPIDWFCRLLRRLTGTFGRVARLRVAGLSTMPTRSTDSATGALNETASEPNGDAPPKDSSTSRPPKPSVKIATAPEPTAPDRLNTFIPLSVVSVHIQPLPVALDDGAAPSGDLPFRRRRPNEGFISNGGVDRIKNGERSIDTSMSGSTDLSSSSAEALDRPEHSCSSTAEVGETASVWGCRLSVAPTECEPRAEANSDRVAGVSLLQKPTASPDRLRRNKVSAEHEFHEANAAREAHARAGRGAEGCQSVDSVGSLASPNRLRRPEVSAGHDVHEANAALDAHSRRALDVHSRRASRDESESPTHVRFLSPLASLQAHSTPSAAAPAAAPRSPPSAAAQVERRRCLRRALHANPVFGTVSEEQLDELCPRMEVGPPLTLTPTPNPKP